MHILSDYREGTTGPGCSMKTASALVLEDIAPRARFTCCGAAQAHRDP